MSAPVIHLVDDCSFGGVNRMLEYMVTSERSGIEVDQRLVFVRRGQLYAPRIEASVIVSHLAVNWANVPLLTALRSRYADVPIVHVEHSYSERFAAGCVDNRDRFETLLPTVYSLFDRVVAVSRAQARWLERRGHCPVQKLLVIASCSDLRPFLEIAPVAPKPLLTIGAVGRFHAQKGFDILVRAVRRSNRADIALHLHGDGPEREHLATLAGNDRRITLHPYCDSMAGAIGACDAVAMPSRWEPFGLVGLETMAAGRTLLCPRVDGLRDHIAAGAMDIGDNAVDNWALALDMLDPGHVRSRGVAGRAVARRSAQRFAGSWNDLLAALQPGMETHDRQRAA